MTASVTAALAAMLGSDKFGAFCADLVAATSDGGGRRIELRGDGQVRVLVTGAAPRGPSATTIGSWQGRATLDVVHAVVAACAKAGLDAPRAPAVPAEGLVLAVQAGAAGARTMVSGASAAALVEAFEFAARGATPVATVALELVLAAGAPWKGEIRLVAGGSQPLVVLHPARAAAQQMLTLERDGKPQPLTLAPGPGSVVLAPGAVLAVPFEVAPLPGKGPVRLSWRRRAPGWEARFGAFPAPEGVFVSPDVSV